MKILSDRMLRIKDSAGHFRCTDLHALLNNFEDRVRHAELYALKVLLNIPAVHVCVDRPSRSPHEQVRPQGSAHRAY